MSQESHRTGGEILERNEDRVCHALPIRGDWRFGHDSQVKDLAPQNKMEQVSEADRWEFAGDLQGPATQIANS